MKTRGGQLYPLVPAGMRCIDGYNTINWMPLDGTEGKLKIFKYFLRKNVVDDKQKYESSELLDVSVKNGK